MSLHGGITHSLNAERRKGKSKVSLVHLKSTSQYFRKRHIPVFQKMAHTSIARLLQISESGTYQYNKKTADFRKWHKSVFQKIEHTSISRRLQITENGTYQYNKTSADFRNGTYQCNNTSTDCRKGTYQYNMTSASNDNMFNMVLCSVNAPKNDNSL
jgi:hypothetical protein